MYDWDFYPLVQFWPALVEGLKNTIIITVLSCVIGTILAVLSLFVVLYYPGWRATLVRVIAEVFIALPIPVLLVWIYYCLPLVWVNIDPIPSAVIAMSLSLAGFLLEMFRGIARTIPPGQIDVAIVAALPRSAVARNVILPQVLRAAQPGLVANYMATLKLSSLAAMISAPELLYQANLVIATTYRPLEVYTAVAVVFLLLVLPLTRIQARLERL